MKKFLFVALLALPALAQSQSLLDRVKQKAKARADQKIDQGIDRALDGAENAATNEVKKGDAAPDDGAGAKPAQPSAAPSAKPPATTFKSYSRYDFVPGEHIVYAEDFAEDVIGEFPVGWCTDNRGETVAIEGFDGRWLRLFKDGRFLSPYINGLPASFTAEFDLVLHLPPNVMNSNFPLFNLHLLSVAPGDEKGRRYFGTARDASTDVRFAIAPYPDENSRISLFVDGPDNHYFSKEGKELPALGGFVDKRIHISLWVQKERLRLWINGEKIFDMPQALPEAAGFNRIGFATGDSPYGEEATGYYVSNFRFAQGAPDLRSKLITDGRFSTSGILFDAGSDTIKPESAGVLAGIAQVLRENASVRVKIVGHTDSDGDDAKNLSLSKARAAAVKAALCTQYGLDAARFETDGKGETQPAAPNTTAEGKARNRRVEFIRL
ncbi:MAG: OmpA family protein [Chitinophagaceae bacterium]|nr:MAG: OmpA family protein [Chitinophagaceae bacterium]